MKTLKRIGLICLTLFLITVAFGTVTIIKAVSGIDNNDAFVQTIQASAASFVDLLSQNGNALEKTLTANSNAFTQLLNHYWKLIDKIWTP